MIRWALLMPDGRLVEGEGRPDGFTPQARAAVGGVVALRGGVSIYVVGGLDVLWTVERAMATHAEVAVYWGIAPPAGSRVWLSPRGMIGIGPSIEAVEGLFERMFAASRRAGKG